MQTARLFVIGVFALLAGCAATGVKYTEMKASVPALKPGEGRIYFYRSASMVGAAIQPEIKLNGVTVGSSVPGGVFFVDRPAGNYEASAATEVERKLTFTLATGETKYVRTYPSFGVMVGRINFELLNAAVAEAQLAPLSHTAPTPSH